jgi:hypothetical protein
MPEVDAGAGVPGPGGDTSGFGEDVVAAVCGLAKLGDGFGEVTLLGGASHRGAVERSWSLVACSNVSNGCSITPHPNVGDENHGQASVNWPRCMKQAFAGKRISRIEMMIVPASIVLMVGYVSPILWTIGLTLLITGIVVLVAAEKSRHAGGRRYRY